jgi:hypothetical protein
MSTVICAWQAYRASQQAPWTPGLGQAQSRLWHLLEPHTRTDDRAPQDAGEPDTEAICEALDDLVTALLAGNRARRAA